jgi:hypothetical protein
MNTLCERSEPAVAAIDQPHPSLTGTWTIDPAESSASLTWRNLRLLTMTARLHCVGVVHLDEPPPVSADFHATGSAQGLGEVVAQGAVAPPGDGGLGGEAGFAQHG